MIGVTPFFLTAPAEVLIPAGPFVMGTDTEPWALDNERPAHLIGLPAFHLDTTPVSNAAYQRFIEDGGYNDPRWWTERGWTHRMNAGLVAPLFWSRDAGSGCAAGSAPSRRCHPRSQCCTSVGTRRMRTPGGQPTAADRGRVGEGRPARPGD